jgi:hypothetical protein
MLLKLLIVSSLGAIPKRILEDLKDILGRSTAKSTIELWGKRLCITAIRDSFCVWMKTKEGVYNLMKEKRERLHDVSDVSDGELKDRIEEILFDYGSQNQEVDVSLKDEVGENDEPRRRDLIENNFVAEV